MPAGAGLEWAIRHKRILLHTKNQLTKFLPSLAAPSAIAPAAILIALDRRSAHR
jgi:urease accessory protein UreF